MVTGKVDVSAADQALGIDAERETMPGGNLGSPDYWEQKARHEKLKADLTEIELKAKRGELVPLDDVMDEIEKTFTALRQRILAVPTKAAPMVFGLKTLAEIKKVLDDEIHETLVELSTGRYRENSIERGKHERK
ncbi:MAG: hypothetical protein HZA02_05225 [Nitrospinae bacterium]|nr:hypothetical protein [Nitrospinota bacterium]